MGMLTTEALARFCIEQSLSFDAHDWLLLTEFDEKKVGLAAKYLSMTSWYGHEEDLEAIAGYAHIFDSTTAGLGGGMNCDNRNSTCCSSQRRCAWASRARVPLCSHRRRKRVDPDAVTNAMRTPQ